jgi:SAM-dependent methyltransferase
VHIEADLLRARAFARGTLLDVGCGPRRYEPIFEGLVSQYFGLDWPAEPDRARPHVIADALRLPIRSHAVDTVLATELMEHLPSSDEFLDEAARVLRVNGALILTVPFMEPLHEEPRDFLRFTPNGLRALLQRHGFALRHLWQRGGWWSVVLGSFVNQSLYDWATDVDAAGRRRYGLASIVVLPLCAILQWLAYHLDRIRTSPRYALGFTVVATRQV